MRGLEASVESYPVQLNKAEEFGITRTNPALLDASNALSIVFLPLSKTECLSCVLSANAMVVEKTEQVLSLRSLYSRGRKAKQFHVETNS